MIFTMKNYFYDLPDELQAEIYKKVFNNVINELTSIINIKNIDENFINKIDLRFAMKTLTIFHLLAKKNNYLYKISVKDALCFEKVFKILFSYNHLKIIQGQKKKFIYWNGHLGEKIISLKYTYCSSWDLFRMICLGIYNDNKYGIYSYLYYTNRQSNVYRSWTKKRLIQYCMKM